MSHPQADLTRRSGPRYLPPLHLLPHLPGAAREPGTAADTHHSEQQTNDTHHSEQQHTNEAPSRAAAAEEDCATIELPVQLEEEQHSPADQLADLDHMCSSDEQMQHLGSTIEQASQARQPGEYLQAADAEEVSDEQSLGNPQRAAQEAAAATLQAVLRGKNARAATRMINVNHSEAECCRLDWWSWCDDNVILDFLSRLDITQCDPWVVRASCRRTVSLFETKGGAWSRLLLNSTGESSLTPEACLRRLLKSRWETTMQSSLGGKRFNRLMESDKTKLDLAGDAELSKLPALLGSLTKLTVLNLEHCSSLLELPNSIGNLVSLEQLWLNGCTSLTWLPESIGGLSKLSWLSLGSCSKLHLIPQSIGNLRSLKELSLKKFPGDTIPDSINSLCSLQKLWLNGCTPLLSLPQINGLLQLTSLYLDQCTRIAALPESIAALVLLEQLSLRGCSALAGLPKGLAALSRLSHLWLNGCYALTEIPNLSSLGSVTIYFNAGQNHVKNWKKTGMHAYNGTREVDLSVKSLDMCEHGKRSSWCRQCYPPGKAYFYK